MEFKKDFSQGFIKDIEDLFARGDSASVILEYEKGYLQIDMSFKILSKEAE